MYFKHSLLLLLSVLYTQVSRAQDRKTVDQIFYEVSGPVKTMTEKEEVLFPESTHKDTSRIVFYFDKEGRMYKTAYYNHFNGDKPGPPSMGNMTYFKKQQGRKRYYYKIQTDTKKETEFYTLQLVNDTTLKYSFSTIMGKDTLFKIFTLNQNNRFITSVSSGKVYRFPATKRLDYSYNAQGKMTSIRITDTDTKESLEVHLQGDTYDQYGNMISGQYVTADHKIVYRINRTYTYYTQE